MANELNDTGVHIVPKDRMNFSWRPSGSAMPSVKDQEQRFLGSQPVNVTPVVDPNSATSGMDALSSLYTSPAKEEELRKASVQRRRILAVADALRHIGNIYQTTRYAPSQKFSSPVVEEESRYRQDKALRDADNVRFMSYQQAKAAQDAKMRASEAEMKYKNDLLAHYREQEKRLMGKQALDEARFDWKKEYDQEILAIKKMHEDGIITKAEMQNALNWARERRLANSQGGGNGVSPYQVTEETVYQRNENGDVASRTVHKKRTVGNSQGTQSGTGYDAPKQNNNRGY